MAEGKPGRPRTATPRKFRAVARLTETEMMRLTLHAMEQKTGIAKIMRARIADIIAPAVAQNTVAL